MQNIKVTKSCESEDLGSTADSIDIDNDSMVIRFDSLSSLVKLKKELERRHINLNNIYQLFTTDFKYEEGCNYTVHLKEEDQGIDTKSLSDEIIYLLSQSNNN